MTLSVVCALITEVDFNFIRLDKQFVRKGKNDRNSIWNTVHSNEFKGIGGIMSSFRERKVHFQFQKIIYFQNDSLILLHIIVISPAKNGKNRFDKKTLCKISEKNIFWIIFCYRTKKKPEQFFDDEHFPSNSLTIRLFHFNW